MKNIHYVTFLLLVVGGLNWFLVGLFNWDIGAIFGGMGAPLSRIIYLLAGLSAVYEAATHRANCRVCGEAKEGKMAERKMNEMPQRP